MKRSSVRRALLVVVAAGTWFGSAPRAGAVGGVELAQGRVVQATFTSPFSVPADGRLRGRDADAVVTRVAWPETVRSGGVLVVAGSGSRLVVFSVTLSEPEGDVEPLTPTHGTPSSFSLRAGTGTDAVPMTALDNQIAGALFGHVGTATATFAAAVPVADERHVTLVLTQGGSTQGFDLWALRRAIPSPAVLYRSQTGDFSVTAASSGTGTIPVTAPTGANLPVRVSATAAYLSAFPPPGSLAPPHATPTLAYLDVQLLGTDQTEQSGGGAYTADSTTYPAPMAASRLTFTPKGGKEITATEAGGVVSRAGPHDTGLFDAWYSFAVQSSLTNGTLSVLPGPVTGEVCSLATCTAPEPVSLGPATLAMSFPSPPAPAAAQPTPSWVHEPLPPTGTAALGASPKSEGGGAVPPPGSDGFPLWVVFAGLSFLAALGYMGDRLRARRQPRSADGGVHVQSEPHHESDESAPGTGRSESGGVLAGESGTHQQPGDHASAVQSERGVRPPALGGDGDVVVRVLGPPVAEGWAVPGERTTLLLSVLCFLALHPERPRSSEELAATIGGDTSEKTARNNLSRLRRAIGDPHLPDAALAGGYQLRGVVTDWARFEELTAEAEGVEGTRRTALLAEAFAHVRGRPFEGAHPGAFHWVDDENLDHQMTAAIVRAAHELSSCMLAAGDAPSAAAAAQRGLRISATDVNLWRDLLVATERVGDPGAVARLRTAAARALGPGAASLLTDSRAPITN